jgi:hypothetical protein
LKRNVLLIAILGIGFVAVLVYSTIGQKHYRCEVCVEFQGRRACRTAASATRDQAVRTATENACALIASGMTDSIACGNTPPASLKWLD